MKSLFWVGWFGVLVLVADAAEAATTRKIEDFAWLAGRWEFERAGRVVREEWMAPAGGTMLGVSRTVKEGRTVEFEFMRLAVSADGQMVFTAWPGGQGKTEFQCSASSATSFTVENKQNDFPQRVSYALQPDGSLLAWIEGEISGKTRRVEFPYRRVP